MSASCVKVCRRKEIAVWILLYSVFRYRTTRYPQYIVLDFFHWAKNRNTMGTRRSLEGKLGHIVFGHI